MPTFLTFIGSCKRKKQDIVVFRDQHGKFYVKNNDVLTQKRLTAKEIVCYLLHMANDEI